MQKELYVSYSQIAVFQAGIQHPFNDWEPVHVVQGFSWREGSVSFGTLDEAGTCRVRVAMGHALDDRRAQRIIQVPFRVSSSSRVEIASITEGFEFCLPEGDYNLIFRTGLDDKHGMWCDFSYLPGKAEPAQILLADEEITPPATLQMNAEPAV